MKPGQENTSSASTNTSANTSSNMTLIIGIIIGLAALAGAGAYVYKRTRKMK